MQILYNDKSDLFYLRLDDVTPMVVNRRLCDDIVLDLGEDDRIVEIEFMDTSRHLNLQRLLPVNYGPSS